MAAARLMSIAAISEAISEAQGGASENGQGKLVTISNEISSLLDLGAGRRHIACLSFLKEASEANRKANNFFRASLLFQHAGSNRIKRGSALSC